MNKVDEVDSAGNPICVVTYSSGLKENSIAFDGRCADYSDDEIRAVLDGQKYRPLPMPSSDLLDYYFQDLPEADTPGFCKAVLVEAEVLEGSGSLLSNQPTVAVIHITDEDTCKTNSRIC